jgi:bla regulator protein blaR1
MNPGYVSALANHLWQSTLFAGLAGSLTLALRNNHARVRYGVWLAASCKFLIPLSVLIALGGHVRWWAVTETTQSNMTIVMDEVSQPFTAPAISGRRVAPPLTPSPLPEILLAGWALGFLGISGAWWIRWRRIRDAVHAGSHLQLEIPIRAVSSPTSLEPGVFGVLRPVLLLPEGMFDRLTPPQVEAVIAHELCHVRHRDNLAAALHMFVETVFWFHPLVWWVGKRIVEERERACDEEVLWLGSEPRVYAEGILNICKLSMEAPLVCVSGITGSNLRKRIEEIMGSRVGTKLDWGRRLLLVSVGIVAAAGPFAMGLVNARSTQAQSQSPTPPSFEVASVKPNKSSDTRSPSMILPGGRFTATNNTVRALILNAYGISTSPYLLQGGPGWIDSARYDIDAKAGANAIPAGTSNRVLWEKTRLMLQALLADRFKLSIRRETEEMPAYQLVVAKNGAKLQKSDADCDASVTACHGFSGNPTRLSGSGVDTYDLALILSNYSDRPVIDPTGIQGLFDLKLQWNPFAARPQAADDIPRSPAAEAREGPRPDLASLPNLFDALEQQLGLKLESHKGPVEIYVIDHVAPPSEN